MKLLFISSLFININIFNNFKTHDDFPYYHLPYSYNLSENKIQFGLVI